MLKRLKALKLDREQASAVGGVLRAAACLCVRLVVTLQARAEAVATSPNSVIGREASRFAPAPVADRREQTRSPRPLPRSHFWMRRPAG